MQLKIFIVLLAISIICVASAQKAKNKDEIIGLKKLWNLEEKLDRLKMAEQQLQDEIENELETEDDESEENYEEEEEEKAEETYEEREEERVDDIIDFPALSNSLQESTEGDIENPCADKYCDAGQECVITKEAEGVCQCVSHCEDMEDERRKVCSNHNDTWVSDCQLHQMRCFCTEGDERCTNEKFKHMHIDYYGSCQELENCEEDELKDFPRRMREWLFNIMEDMTEKNEVEEKFLKLKEKSDDDQKNKWLSSAIWKWCQLDTHPKDKSVSRHEIFPVRAPLYTLEHCISPFLDSCDPDGDHYITLKEWTACLELSQESTDDLEDLCEDIRDQDSDNY